MYGTDALHRQTVQKRKFLSRPQIPLKSRWRDHYRHRTNYSQHTGRLDRLRRPEHGHTSDANTTSLSIRHDRTAERGQQARRSSSMRVLRSRFSRAAHAYPVPVRHISMLHTLIRSQTLHLMPPLHILRAHMIVHSCQHHHHMLRCMAKRWQTSHLYKQRSTRPKRASPRAATYIAACGSVSEQEAVRSRHGCSSVTTAVEKSNG